MRPNVSSFIFFFLFHFIPTVHAQPKLLPPHIPDSMDHFIKNKKPLAQNQDVLLTKQFFKYILTLPVEAWKCSLALYKKQTFTDFIKSKEVFEVFYLLQKNRNTMEFSMDFQNHGGDFGPVCDTKHGVCQGLTNLDRRMNMLAYYDPGNILGAKVPPESEPEARFRFYEKRIKEIRNDQPTVIPGFENLLQFSRDRLGRRVLLEAVVKNWASENATIPGITQVLAGTTHQIDPGEARDLFAKVKARLTLHYNPILYLTQNVKQIGGKWIHVMQATGVESNPDGTQYIILKDPNLSLSGSNRSSALNIDKNGQMTYMGMQLAEVDFMPGDDMEISQFLVNTIRFCEKYPIFCVEGGAI